MIHIHPPVSLVRRTAARNVPGLLVLGLVACVPPHAPGAEPAVDAAALARHNAGEPAEPAPPVPTAPAKPSPAAIPPEPMNPTEPAAPTVQPALTSTPAPSGAWHTYRNERAGYLVDYPATWTATEQTDPDGSAMTVFQAPAGGAVTIVVRRGEQQPAIETDVPNNRCREVTVGGRSAVRCFDTIAGVTATMLSAQGRTHLFLSGKLHDEAVYQRMLDTFALLPGA